MKERQEEELEETMRLLRPDYLAVYAKSRGSSNQSERPLTKGRDRPES